MGDLSFHFNHRDFACHCKECDGTYRIDLGLVGALELIAEHFNKKVKVLDGYRCEAYIEKLGASPKSKHARGKAANFAVEEVPIIEVYKFAETIPEVKGLGFYPDEGFVHIDIRKEDKKEWIREGGRVTPFTTEKKRQYGVLA